MNENKDTIKKSKLKTVFVVSVFLLLFLSSLTYFFYEVYYIDEYNIHGDSMVPTFKDGEIVKSSMYLKGITSLKNDDVIILNVDDNVMIKRLIAQEGDTIEIKNGQVFVNEMERDNHLNTVGDVHLKLNKNEYFVLGDNRKVSNDSRYFGVIYSNQILGVLERKMIK